MPMSRTFRIVSFSCLLPVVLHAAPLDWPASGLPLATGPTKQRAPEIWPDGQGGAFVSWVEQRDQRLHDVIVQRLTREGVPAAGWPAAGVRRTNVYGNDAPPDVYWSAAGATTAPDGNGGVYLAWRDRRNYPYGGYDYGDLFLVRYDARGQVAEGWPADGIALSIAYEYEEDPVLLPDGAGGVFAAWARPASHGWYEVRTDHVRADATRPAGWTEGGLVSTRTPIDWHQDMPVLALDGQGGVYVGWRTSRGGEFPSFGIGRILGDGRLADWPEQGLALGEGHCQDLRLASGPNGDAYAVWTRISTLSSVGWEVHVARVMARGTVRVGWPDDGVVLTTRSYSSYNTQVASDGGGGVYVAWQNYVGWFGGIGTRMDVRVQRIDPDGRMLFADPVLASPTQSVIDNLQMIDDGMGGTLATWSTQPEPGTDDDLFARRVDSNGEISVSSDRRGTPVNATSGTQTHVRLASDGAGGFYAAWVDLREDPLGDVYAQWVRAEAFVPPPPPRRWQLRLSQTWPNPASEVSTTLLELPSERPVVAELFDVHGARVRTLARQVLPVGRTTLTWNGRDDGGRLLPPGVYLLDVRAGELRETRRLVRVP